MQKIRSERHTLYEPSFEHDNCGIGAVVNIDGTKSHKIVDNALSIVEKLEHRAGKDASGETGDGVGILLQISHKFFTGVAERGEIIGVDGAPCKKLGGERDYGIGMFFFPGETGAGADSVQKANGEDGVQKANSAPSVCDSEKARFEKCCAAEKLALLGWRKVPVAPDVLGKKARDCMPEIWQAFIARPDGKNACAPGVDFDRRLYILRREFEKGEFYGVGSDGEAGKTRESQRFERVSVEPLRDLSPAEGEADDTVRGRSGGEPSPAENMLYPPRSFKMVDTCAGEFDAETPYFYSTTGGENEAELFLKEKRA